MGFLPAGFSSLSLEALLSQVRRYCSIYNHPCPHKGLKLTNGVLIRTRSGGDSGGSMTWASGQ